MTAGVDIPRQSNHHALDIQAVNIESGKQFLLATNMSHERIKISINLKPDEDLSHRYDRAVEKWLATQDPAESRIIYVEETFPLGCMRMRAARRGVQQLDLLFVPVGTQPFAPIMAIVGNPARCIALLETTESHPFGLQVEQAFVDEQKTAFLHVKIDPSDTIDIGIKMKAVFDSRGLPVGAQVGADITGGKKPTTAAVAGVGSVFGWRLFYVDATFERKKEGFGHHERVVELPNVIDVFGERKRETIFALLEAGAFEPGIKQLEELVEESAASRADRLILELARAAYKLRQGNYRSACALVRQAVADAEQLGGKDLADELAKFEGRDNDPSLDAAWMVVAARALHKENNDQAAKYLLYQASDVLTRPWKDGSVPALLKEFADIQAIKAYLNQLAPIESIIGSHWSTQLRALRP